MKKYIALFMAVCIVAVGSCAWAEFSLVTVHRSITDFVDGKPNYSPARFLAFWVGVEDYDAPATSEDVNLTGTMTFSGGNYSFWDMGNGMRHISGTEQTFGLASDMDIGSWDRFYEPVTSNWESYLAFCLEADGGLNGVNVSWTIPGKPEYSGHDTITNYRTTQQQLDSFVPYVEYIRNGSQVTGLRWRAVKLGNPEEALTFDFRMGFRVFGVRSTNGNALYSGSWQYVEAGNPVSGEVIFDSPINEADISLIIAALGEKSTELHGIYQWWFRKPSAPKPRLWTNHLSRASLINGKSDYSDAKFRDLIIDVDVDDIFTEAKYFTYEGRMTIPGGGYSLKDNNKGEELGVTVPAGTDREYALGIADSSYIFDTFIEYVPTDENGISLAFSGESDTGLNGRTVTWKFPAELNLDGSGVIPNFKSTAEELASGVPYVEIVSVDNGNVTVNYKIVTPSDTSTAIAPSYRTDFRIYIDWKDRGYWNSGWLNNKASGAWDTGITFSLADVRRIRARVRSYEESADNPAVYQWNFYPASAPAPITITTSTLPSGTVNAPYTANLAANVSGATWSLISGTLPAGLTLNPSTGAISGTPTSAGTSTFTVRASMPGRTSGEKQLSITVGALPPVTISITTSSLPAGVRGTAYSATLAASTSPVTWSVSSGTLPAGLSLSSAGVISGTPTSAGTSTFTVRAVSGSASAQKQLSITVSNPEPTPQTTLEISTSSLPEATAGQPYSATLTANISGVTWSLVSGSLPAGLSLSSAGEISGTPEISDTYTFTVRAVSGSSSAEKQLSITVYDAPHSSGGGGCESFMAIAGLAVLAFFLKKR